MKLQFLTLALALAAISSATAPHGPPRPSRHSPSLQVNSPLLALHQSLCEIPSLTNSEAALSDWLASYLQSHSFTVEKQSVGLSPGRTNIYAYLGSRNTRTLLTSHLDTVAPYIPYTLHANGTITGRGTNDAKGSIAAQIIAVEELRAVDAIGLDDVALLYVVGEETGGEGMRAANELGVSWEAVVFGEPTENRLSLGHKGAMMITVEAEGKAAHSGYPDLGVDANRRLVEALWRLDEVELPGSELLGGSTLNYGLIRGGVAANVVSAAANASVAVRLAVEGRWVRRVIDSALEGLPVKLVYGEGGYGPVVLDHDVEGFETEAHSYGTDIPYLKGDHKKYLYGPGSITSAHGDNEFVTVADLEEAVEGYKILVLHTLA